MTTEQTTATPDDQAAEDAFRAAFAAEQSGQRQPAAEQSDAPAASATPAQAAEATEGEAATEQEDEFAGLPPNVRERLSQLEDLQRAAALIPTLEQRLRKAEGRLGDLNGRIHAPAPQPAAKLEKVEALKSEWPELVEAMQELLDHNKTSGQQQSDNHADAAQAADDLPTPTLDTEMPGWDRKLTSPQFQTWLAAQPEDYRKKVASTDNEGVILAALSRFDTHSELQGQRQQAAQKAAQTRQSRAAAAVVPQTAGARVPTNLSDEDVFRQAFARARGTA